MDEKEFQSGIRDTEWFRQFVKEYGEEPDLDTKDYNYRAAWAAGLRPEPYEPDGGRYHWPSSLPDGTMLKSEDHPTAWMEYFMRATGKDPNELGVTREQLRFPEREPSDSEREYFQTAPHVGGMMSQDPEDDSIVMNPFSELDDSQKDAVRVNERARVFMRRFGGPSFELTGPQEEYLNTTDYKDASPEDRRATIAARILSRDSSAQQPSEDQVKYADQLRRLLVDEE